jgi:hypothetical protein
MELLYFWPTFIILKKKKKKRKWPAYTELPGTALEAPFVIADTYPLPL